jgi:fluoroquinolone resistance protein
MNTEIIENKTFKNIDYSNQGLDSIEYENCTFVNCNLASLDLSGYTFLECKFSGCDLSNSKLKDTSLKDIRFFGCKLLGVLFNTCNELLLSFTFEECQMNLTSFHRLRIKGTTFRACNLIEADFALTDLTGTLFDGCDLSRAMFENTNLEKADFRTSFNYSFDPEINKIKKAKFSRSDIHGLLDKYNIEID